MKRKFVILLVFIMCMGICCFAGYAGCSCDGDDVVVHDTQPQPDDQSHTECDYDFPNEEKLGLPLYKDNVLVTTVESSTTESEGVVTDIGVDYSTTSDFKTVATWYKDQLGAPTKSLTTPDGKQQMTWESSEGGYYNLIVVTETADATAISVIKTQEAK